MEKWFEGRDAARDGRPLTDCVDKPGTVEWRDWQGGWMTGDTEMRGATGERIRRTIEERAEGKAAMVAARAVGYVEDPAETILGHPLEYTADEADRYLTTGRRPRSATSEPEPPEVRSLRSTTVTWRPNAAKKLWPDPPVTMSFSIQLDEQALQDAIRQVQQVYDRMTTVEPGTLVRARHGAAARCPIHGPTTGGLCRHCQRALVTRAPQRSPR